MINIASEPIVVACAADDSYAMSLAVTVRSLLTNLDKAKELVVFVLDGGIKEHQKKRIIQSISAPNVSVEWVKPSEFLAKTLAEKVTVSGYWPIANYYRLLLPQIVPTQFEKVIYLDTDVVVTGDLAQLWNIDIQDNYVLAVQDVYQPYVAKTNHLDHQKFGLSEDCKYLNAGVLVLNLKQWRDEGTAEKILDFIELNRETLLFPDQDALNIVLAKRWGELQPYWNQMHGIYDFPSWKESPYNQDAYEKAMQAPAIIHYTTLPKPWMRGCIHPEKGIFYHYLDQTAWVGWRNTLLRRAWRRLTREVRQRMG